MLDGQYRHSAPLTITARAARVVGRGRLIGTNSSACALVIAADDVTVEDITLAVLPTVRHTNMESAALLVGADSPVRGFRARRLHLTGSGALIRRQSSDFLLEDVLVTDSQGDGIHMTNGVHHGVVSRPTVINSGDDGVAVVSYRSDPSACRDIVIRSPRVRSVRLGRGVSVVGGVDVRIHDVDISQTSGAALYIACEDNADWRTYPPQSVQVKGGTITAANVSAPKPEHGAVLVINESATDPIEAVDISGLVIRDTQANFRVLGFIGGTGGHVGCRLADIFVSGSSARLVTDVSGGTVAISDVRVGVTHLVPHPAEDWLTNPNGRLAGAHGSTAVLLNGSFWFKMTTGDTSGWQRLGGMG